MPGGDEATLRIKLEGAAEEGGAAGAARPRFPSPPPPPPLFQPPPRPRPGPPPVPPLFGGLGMNRPAEREGPPPAPPLMGGLGMNRPAERPGPPPAPPLMGGLGMNRPAPQPTNRGTPLAMPLGMNRPAQPPEPLLPQLLQMLGGGTGGLGNLAQTAAPVAAAAGFVAVLKRATDALEAFASALTDPADDPSQLIATFGDETKKTGYLLAGLGAGLALVAPPVGAAVAALGALGIVAGTVGEAFADLMRNLDAFADRYAAYSPELTQAQALAEVTHTLGELRRAQQIGPELARYVQARTELQQHIEDLKVRFMAKVLPLVVKVVEFLDKILPEVSSAPAETAQFLDARLAGHPILQALEFWLRRENRKEEEKAPDEDFLTAVLFNQQQPTFPFRVAPTGGAQGP